MRIAHLTSSTFYGGPERQMCELAKALTPDDETAFLSFAEGGRCQPFLRQVRKQGFEAIALKADTPYFRAAVAELTAELNRLETDVLCCHGYKANLLGRVAARRRGIPVIAVSRGWTGECLKVKVYETLDRIHLRCMDHVVCVSEAQAKKVRRTGVAADRLSVIHNAVDLERFTSPDARYRQKLERNFRHIKPIIVGAIGRLSPEKGFDIFLNAAALVREKDPNIGFVLYGAGPCKDKLAAQIKALALSSSFVLGGFRADLDRFLPFFDLLVLPSYTEGLPNVVLEAFAAGVPVVATAVGGTPELITDAANGYLVAPGNAEMLAEKILQAVASPEHAHELGRQGREVVEQQFAFAEQAARYRQLFAQLVSTRTSSHENEAAQQPVVALSEQGSQPDAIANPEEAAEPSLACTNPS